MKYCSRQTTNPMPSIRHYVYNTRTALVFSGSRCCLASRKSLPSSRCWLCASELVFHLLEDKLEICEEQYRKILYHPWVDAFKSNLPENPVDFWSFVKRYEVDNHKPYEELSNYALQCLTTPVSNAVLERIFSHVTAVKTKARNRMSLKMLEAILRVRTTLIVSGKCCKDLEITGDMLQKFTVDIYDHARGPIASLEDNDNVIDDLY